MHQIYKNNTKYTNAYMFRPDRRVRGFYNIIINLIQLCAFVGFNYN